MVEAVVVRLWASEDRATTAVMVVAHFMVATAAGVAQAVTAQPETGNTVREAMAGAPPARMERAAKMALMEMTNPSPASNNRPAQRGHRVKGVNPC